MIFQNRFDPIKSKIVKNGSYILSEDSEIRPYGLLYKKLEYSKRKLDKDAENIWYLNIVKSNNNFI